MASEYIKWQLEQEKKEQEDAALPAQKKPLTRKEAASNWFYYNKWFLLIGLGLLAGIASLVFTLTHPDPTPDYQIGYIGTRDLPEETAAALEEAFSAIGEDVNGDGQVLVRINQYVVEAWEDEETSPAEASGSGPKNPYTDLAGAATLMADLQEGNSIVFLMEDPEGMQERFAFLSRLDGSAPPEGASAQGCYLSWKDCPWLRDLPLGTFTWYKGSEEVITDSQELLSTLFLGRRIVNREDPTDQVLANDRLWDTITRDASR